MTQTLQIKGLSALAIATALLLWISFLINRSSQPLLSGIVIGAGVQSMLIFGALLWALPRSNRAFFSIFVGDALLRMTGLGMITFWLWSRHLSYTVPLLSLAFAYLLLSLIQISFFCQVK